MNLDNVGVSDLTLLEDLDDKTVLSNLKERFTAGKIYTSIGDVVISINPYRKLDIYGNEVIQQYRGKQMFEIPPHVFSVAENAYRNMSEKNQDQCVIISGESGAGKTEASKLIMKYIAAVSASTEKVDKIKEQLLNSNPCLEAFGNAKTLRNDNSSRFGKYMDLEFDFKGDPVGGKVTTYLLEKSRVVKTIENERTFHIFYQIIRGSDDKLKNELKLTRNPGDYAYLKSKSETIPDLDDKAEFQNILKAMKAIGFEKDEQQVLFDGVAAILHLGNVNFSTEEGKPGCFISPGSTTAANNAADLLGITTTKLSSILTQRIVKDMKKSGAQDMTVVIETDKAYYSRDALCKALYGRLFAHLVKIINSKINHPSKEKINMIGVLDIYGFEVFARNGFEQFCINYCNEKLQQLFIELTLQSEQEDYAREGITWTHIEYFNNNVICDLIEAKNRGIIALLDEECMRPGDVTDLTFLNKLNQVVVKHAHFDSREKSKSDKTLDPTAFRLKHYAGLVVYDVDGFIDKNTDMLSKDILYGLNSSSKAGFKELFPENASQGDLKRPETLGTQFKSSINQLMENLLAKSPHYVRCIKPNSEKKPNHLDDQLVDHQNKYLGLLENIRVRRAGYCFRQKYDKFLNHYKMCSKDTWPHWKGELNDGVAKIMESVGIPSSEFALGVSKVFIKNPRTIFQLEAARERAKHPIVSKVRAQWLACVGRKKFLKMKASAIKMEATWRMVAQKKKFKKEMGYCVKVQTLIRGYLARKRYKIMVRKQPKRAVPIIQRFWIGRLKKEYISILVKDAVVEAGTKWRTIKWPAPTASTKSLSVALKRVYNSCSARKYRNSLSPELKNMLELKAAASNLLTKKKIYLKSIQYTFKGDYMALADAPNKNKWAKANPNNESVLFALEVEKRHRGNPAASVPRAIIMTNKSLMIVDPKSFAVKESLELVNLQGVTVSPFGDGVFAIHLTNSKKGDYILTAANPNTVIEFVARAYITTQVASKKYPTVACQDTCQFTVATKKQRVKFVEGAAGPGIEFKKDSEGFTLTVPK